MNKLDSLIATEDALEAIAYGMTREEYRCIHSPLHQDAALNAYANALLIRGAYGTTRKALNFIQAKIRTEGAQ